MIFDRYQNAFIPDDGAIVSVGFKKFASYIREQLNASAKMRGFSLAEFKIGHYDMSGFFQKGNQFVYFDYSPVAYRDKQIDFYSENGMTGILYRKANNLKDFTGGENHFSSFVNGFMDAVERLLQD